MAEIHCISLLTPHQFTNWPIIKAKLRQDCGFVRLGGFLPNDGE